MKFAFLLTLSCLVLAAGARRELFQTIVASSSSSSSSFSSSSSVSSTSSASSTSGPSVVDSSPNEFEPSDDRIDVYCLVDNTEANTNFVAELAENAEDLIYPLFNSSTRIRFGLGIYQDESDGFFMFDNVLNLTDKSGRAIRAVSGLVAFNESVPQESQFSALEMVARDKGIGFRGKAVKIIVWIGNRRGKDPVGISTEATATAALVDGDFLVVAIDTGKLNAAGQASRIVRATDGIFYKVNDEGLFDTVELSRTSDEGSSSASASASGDITVVTTTVDGVTTTVTDPVDLIDAILDGVAAIARA